MNKCTLHTTTLDNTLMSSQVVHSLETRPRLSQTLCYLQYHGVHGLWECLHGTDWHNWCTWDSIQNSLKLYTAIFPASLFPSKHV